MAEPGCVRIENGNLTTQRPIATGGLTDCTAEGPMANIFAVTARRYPVVDEEAGAVLGLALFQRKPGVRCAAICSPSGSISRKARSNVYAAMYYPEQEAMVPNWPPFDGNWPPVSRRRNNGSPHPVACAVGARPGRRKAVQWRLTCCPRVETSAMSSPVHPRRRGAPACGSPRYLILFIGALVAIGPLEPRRLSAGDAGDGQGLRREHRAASTTRSASTSSATASGSSSAARSPTRSAASVSA